MSQRVGPAGRAARSRRPAPSPPSGLEVNVDYLGARVHRPGRRGARRRGGDRPTSGGSAPGSRARSTRRAVPSTSCSGCTSRSPAACLALPGLVDPHDRIRCARRRTSGGATSMSVSCCAHRGTGPAAADRWATRRRLAAQAEAGCAAAQRHHLLRVPVRRCRHRRRGGRRRRGVPRRPRLQRRDRPYHRRPRRPACPCGSVGCLERFAGKDALMRRAGLDLDLPIGRPGRGRGVAGDRPRDRSPWTAARGALGIALANVVNLVDVPVVILGGIYGPLAPFLVPGIEAELQARVLSAPWSRPRVEPARARDHAALTGAASAVLAQHHSRPHRLAHSLVRAAHPSGDHLRPAWIDVSILGLTRPEVATSSARSPSATDSVRGVDETLLARAAAIATATGRRWPTGRWPPGRHRPPPVDLGGELPASGASPAAVIDQLARPSTRARRDRRTAVLRFRHRRLAAGGDGGRRARGRLGPVRFNATLAPGEAVVEEVAGGWLKELLGLPARRLSVSSPAGRLPTPSAWPSRGTIVLDAGGLGRGAGRLARLRRGCGSSPAPSGTPPSTGRCGCSASAPRAGDGRGPTRTARWTWPSSPGRSPPARRTTHSWSACRRATSTPARATTSGRPAISCTSAAAGCTSTVRSGCGRRPARAPGASPTASSSPTPGRATGTSG